MLESVSIASGVSLAACSVGIWPILWRSDLLCVDLKDNEGKNMAIFAKSGWRTSPQRRREALAGVLFVSPWIVSLLVFTAYPVLATFYLSMTNYDVISSPQWVGFQNYQAMLTNDPDFWKSLGNTAYYTLISVPAGLIAALGLALVLNMRAKGIGVYRTIFYLPALVPPVATALVFMLLFNTDGLANTFLVFLHLPRQDWLLDPHLSRPVLIVMSLWGVGAATLIFLAGLQEVPQSLLESASLDGAGPWQRFRHVILPMLSPIILFNLIMGIISSFQVFTQAILLGGTDGEPLGSTLMLMVLIYRNAFRYFSMGYAEALAVVLFLLILLLTLVIFLSSRLWVHYEGGQS